MEEKNPTGIKDLPEDVVFNILLRLSAETIYNLRYVFNFWSNIITSSCFHDAHFRGSKHGLLLSRQREDEMIKSKKQKQQPLLIDTNLINTNNKEELITLREFTAASGDILATCNGLVLFGDKKCKTELFVANPATKDLLKLPAHKTGSCLDHIFGMTYIASTGEYKVIHCFIDLVNRSTKNNYCEILTLGCDSWKRVDKFTVGLLLQWSSRKFTFINNIAHCLALEDGCGSCLVSFDMVDEKFHTTIIPIRLSKIDELLEIEGFVALVSHKKFKKTNGCRFQIWLLKDYDKGDWVRLRKIGLGGRNENVSSVTTPQHGTRIIFLQYDGRSKYYYYIGYDVQLNQKRYLDFCQKIPSANVFPHCESLLSCSNIIADEPYTETCKRRKLL